jgi:putative oxidoreductase
MIYKFALGVAIAFLIGNVTSPLPSAALHLLKSLYLAFPAGLAGLTLLLVRVGVGGLFMMHGYPKITHLQQWSAAVKMPIALCFLSVLSMLLGGLGLIVGLLTPLASLAILASMVFAIFLEISGGTSFMAPDPYLIPPDQYQGPKGKGEPPSWEKAFMYCLLLIAIAVLGPGAFSLDALLFG